MPNPKRRHSKRRSSTRRAHDHLTAPIDLKVSALPRAQVAPSRVPALRILQGPRGRGYFGLN